MVQCEQKAKFLANRYKAQNFTFTNYGFRPETSSSLIFSTNLNDKLSRKRHSMGDGMDYEPDKGANKFSFYENNLRPSKYDSNSYVDIKKIEQQKKPQHQKSSNKVYLTAL